MAPVFPVVTAGVAAGLGLLAALLTVQVIRNRVRFRVDVSDGGNAPLAQAIRAHANLAEHAPIALLLLALAEAGGAQRLLIVGLGGGFVIARLASAWALSRSLAQSPPRQAGAGLTVLVTVLAALLILYRLAVPA
ncbi:MAG: MAPEG family protein [Burkholderiaceae bacterium]